MSKINLKGISKPFITLLGTILSAIGLGELIHKGKEAYTRKKAMNAAVRENNCKAKKP